VPRGGPQARRAKRRTVKFCDVEAAVRAERRWGELGLRDVLQEGLFAAARAAPRPGARAGKENARRAPQGASPACEPDAAGTGGQDDGEPQASAGAPAAPKHKRPAARAASPDKRARQITEWFK